MSKYAFITNTDSNTMSVVNLKTDFQEKTWKNSFLTT